MIRSGRPIARTDGALRVHGVLSIYNVDDGPDSLTTLSTSVPPSEHRQAQRRGRARARASRIRNNGHGRAARHRTNQQRAGIRPRPPSGARYGARRHGGAGCGGGGRAGGTEEGPGVPPLQVRLAAFYGVFEMTVRTGHRVPPRPLGVMLGHPCGLADPSTPSATLTIHIRCVPGCSLGFRRVPQQVQGGWVDGSPFEAGPGWAMDGPRRCVDSLTLRSIPPSQYTHITNSSSVRAQYPASGACIVWSDG